MKPSAGVRPDLLISLGLVVLVFLLYRPALGYDFTLFDDHKILLNASELFGPGPLSERLANILFRDFPREEPLLVRDLSWLVDARLFGFANPFGYHLGNLVYHAATVVALFALLLLLTGQRLFAGAAAALFAGLAVNVEPVAWLMGRKDLLAGLFGLLMLLSEVALQRANTRTGRGLCYLAGLLCVLLAALSKISAVVLPAVLLAFKVMLAVRADPKPRPFARSWASPLAQVLPHLALAAAIYLWYRGVVTDFGVLGRARAFSTKEWVEVWLLVNPLALLKYVGLVLLPNGLSAMYTWTGIDADLGWPHVLLATVVIIATAGLSVALYLRRPLAGFFLVAFVLQLAPYLNVVNQGWWYANRYVYAAAAFLVPLVLMAAWPMNRRRRGRIVAGLLALTAAWNIAAQQSYLPVWRDGIALWRYETALPGATLAIHNRLASTYLSRILRTPPAERAALLDEARATVAGIIARYRTAPDSEAQSAETGLPLTYYIQGALRRLAGEPLSAQLEPLEAAHRLAPMHRGVNRLLGEVYLDLARSAGTEPSRVSHAREALRHFGAYIRGGPGPDPAAVEALRAQFRRDFPTLPETEFRDALEN